MSCPPQRTSRAIPVCYRHTQRETYVRWVRCDRPICPDCMRDAAVGHQCPECVAEGRRTQRQPRTAFGAGSVGQRGFVTLALIAVNVLLLLASVASSKNSGAALAGGSMGGLIGGPTPLLDHLAVVGQCDAGGVAVLCGVANGEYWRLLTAMFMHFGLIHLLVNMWA